jgi:hypothetical protein
MLDYLWFYYEKKEQNQPLKIISRKDRAVERGEQSSPATLSEIHKEEETVAL